MSRITTRSSRYGDRGSLLIERVLVVETSRTTSVPGQAALESAVIEALERGRQRVPLGRRAAFAFGSIEIAAKVLGEAALETHRSSG